MSDKSASGNDPVNLVSIGDWLAQQVIVYAHGFGVKYDSKGLFSDLAQRLAGLGHRSVLFDLTDYDDSDNISLVPLSRQVDRLGRVVVQTQQDGDNLVLLAHSMGCLVVAQYLLKNQPTIGRAFLLDPATYNRIGPSMATGYRRRPNARLTADGLELTRDSGRLTKIANQYFQDLDFETADLYRRLSEVYSSQLTVVWAGKAESDRRPRVDFAPAEELVIAGADHNFEDHHQSLVDILAARL